MSESGGLLAGPAAETGLTLRVARVVYVDAASLLVTLEGSAEVMEVRARIQTGSSGPEQLEVGDNVVVAGDGKLLLLWGRITPLRPTAETARLPDTLLIEAKEGLTLRVGDGSITIRADGKILIKGKDLVSHAQRTNRIKGGSVAIN